MKSILIIHNEIPTPNRDQRSFYMIKELSKSYNVTFLVVPYSEYNDNALERIKKYCKVMFVPYLRKDFVDTEMYKALKFFIKSKYAKYSRFFRLQPKRLKITFYQIFCLNNELKNLLKKKKFDYIQVEHFFLGSVLHNVSTDSTKILNFHNVHSYMKNNFFQKWLFKKYEKKFIQIYDFILCCSEIDKRRLGQLGYKNILVISNGVDTNYFKVRVNKKINTYSLLFVGQLYYRPNLEGIKYFFNEIYSLLNLNIRIKIVGKYRSLSMFAKESKYKNVKFYGFKKDIRPYFKNSVFICPLLDGGGTRIKILTAFAAGSPVVSTSKGAEGIEYTNNKDILIANTPQQFARSTNLLLNNKKLYEKIKKNARKLAETKYDWKDIVESYSEDLNNL